MADPYAAGADAAYMQQHYGAGEAAHPPPPGVDFPQQASYGGAEQHGGGFSGRGGRGGGRGGGPVLTNPDDWMCDKCANVNYARRAKCNRCAEPKPGGAPLQAKPKYPAGVLSKQDIAKSNGRHQEGDWACAKCFNVNWAKRRQCNSCNAPKPGTVEEAPREGRGGGFNERDAVVQYKSSRFEDDDDKYDDMGRLKKKYRATATGAIAGGAAVSAGAAGKSGGPGTPPAAERRTLSRSRSRSHSTDRHRRSSSARSRSRSRSRNRSPPRGRGRSRSRSRSRSRGRGRSRSRSPPSSRRREDSRERDRDRARSRRDSRDDRGRSRSRSRDRYRRSSRSRSRSPRSRDRRR